MTRHSIGSRVAPPANQFENPALQCTGFQINVNQCWLTGGYHFRYILQKDKKQFSSFITICCWMTRKSTTLNFQKAKPVFWLVRWVYQVTFQWFVGFLWREKIIEVNIFLFVILKGNQRVKWRARGGTSAEPRQCHLRLAQSDALCHHCEHQHL